MTSKRALLLSTTMIPVFVLAGVVAGGAVMIEKVVVASAWAACQPCNPCAAVKPCSPCAPANPCAAANPCNPCNPGATAGAAVVAACAVPRLQKAAATNPCAVAKPCSPCSPCAAAKACNPCSPCAAVKPCSPCNPCGPAAAVKVTDAEAVTVYDCLFPLMTAAYAKADIAEAQNYSDWRRFSTQSYVSATHGSRFVQNYANAAARAYGNYENAGTFPAGARLAKDSFTVDARGDVAVGPLFLMEKMQAGFNPESDDWRYTLVMPNGTIAGTTNGQGSDTVAFCIGCHQSVTPAQDNVMLLPEKYRVK